MNAFFGENALLSLPMKPIDEPPMLCGLPPLYVGEALYPGKSLTVSLSKDVSSNEFELMDGSSLIGLRFSFVEGTSLLSRPPYEFDDALCFGFYLCLVVAFSSSIVVDLSWSTNRG